MWRAVPYKEVANDPPLGPSELRASVRGLEGYRAGLSGPRLAPARVDRQAGSTGGAGPGSRRREAVRGRIAARAAGERMTAIGPRYASAGGMWHMSSAGKRVSEPTQDWLTRGGRAPCRGARVVNWNGLG